MEIHISKDNEPVDGSPLIVHAFDPAAVSLSDFPEKAYVNTTNRFTIDPSKAGKGSLKVAIKGPTNRSIPINVLKRSHGHVVVEFEPTIAGKFQMKKKICNVNDKNVLGPHTIHVLFNRIPIPETPLRLFVEPKESKKALNDPIEESK